MAARAAELTTAGESPHLASPEAVKLWLSERFAHESDPTAILRTVAETLGRFLRVSRVGYGEIEPGEDWITIRLDWTDGIATMVGRRPLLRHTRLVQDYMRGRTLVVSDTDALEAEEDQRAALRATDTRAFVAVPLIHDGEFVALFACNHHEPRAWRADEVELIQQTGARVWSALQHARTIGRLRESEEQFRQLAENIPALCWLAGADGVATWGNGAYLDYFAATDAAAVSADVVHPDDRDHALTLWADGLTHGTPVETVVRLRGRDGEYRPFVSRATPIRDAAGRVTRWTAVMVDLTEQRQRDEHRRFFDALADAIREETESERILARVGDMLKAYLGTSRVFYAEVDRDEPMTFVVHREAADRALAAGTGRYRFNDRFLPLYDRLAGGDTVAWSSLDGEDAPPARARDFFRQMRMPAVINVPLVKDGRLVAILSAHSATARAWTPAEIALLEDVAERTWSTVTRARAETELKERERTQAFLVAWTDRLRGEQDPAALLDITLEQLGRHLAANRAVYSEIELDGGHYTIISEWCRGVATVRGLSYPASNLSDFVRTAYLAGETVASDDLTRDARYSDIARAKFAEAHVVGRIGVPLTRNGRTQAILAVDTDHPRSWTSGEVQLVREVSDRVWTLLQQARAEAALKRREREQALLLAWNDRVRGEAQPDAVIAATLALVGEHLGATRVSYMEAEAADPRLFTVLDSWCDGVPPIAGRSYSLDWIGEAVNRRFLAGEAVQSADVSVDPNVSQPARDLYAATAIVAVLSVPLVRDGAVRAVLSASLDRPREWHEDDRRLLRELADRMWAMLERARAERALRERERHQAFLLDWVDRLRGETAPERLVAITLERLADYFAVSRANFAEVGADGAFDIVQEIGGTVPRSPTRDGVSSGVHAAYLAGATVVCEDVVADPRFDAPAREAYRAVDAAAFVGVPMVRRGQVHGVLSVQDAAPRRWAQGEIQLLRDVADRLLITIERARAETEIKARERDQAFLLAWSDRLRQLTDPAQILQETLDRLIVHTAVDRATYAESDPDGDLFTILGASGTDPAEVGETYRLSDASPEVARIWLAGGAIRYDDVLGHPRVTAERMSFYERLNTRAFLSVPLFTDGTTGGTLSVQCAAPRVWRDSDEQLVREVAERLWTTLERARATSALAARERHQTFLLAWSDRLRQLVPADAILDETLVLLNAHLGATRTAWAESDAAGEEMTVLAASDNVVEDERYRLADVPAAVREAWLAGGAIRYDDLAHDPRVPAERLAHYARYGIRAFLSVPLTIDGTVRATLSVRCGAPRAWHDDEEQLIRDVAERLWIALERARATATLGARERDQAFLLEWGDRLRESYDPAAVLAATLSAVGAYLGASRATFAQADASGRTFAILDDWCDDTFSLAGTSFSLDEVGATVEREWVAGEMVRYDDVAADPRIEPERVPSYLAAEIAAFVSVPLVERGRVRCALSIQSKTPRAWQENEIALLRAVAERTWIVLERARVQAELAERQRVQTFLIGWSDRVRSEASPHAILALTLDTLGRQLGATRANYAECDAAVTQMTVVDVWGSETAGRGTVFPLAALGPAVVADSLAGRTLVVNDVAVDPRFGDVLDLYREVAVAAVVTVPLVRAGRLIAVLSVQQDVPRAWTPHEVRLIEEVADRTWSVLERAHSEARLAESEAQLSAFMDNAPIAMYLKDRQGRYLRLNRQMGLVLGVDMDEALGGTTHDFMPPAVAQDVARLDALALDGGIHSGEIHIEGRDAYLHALSVRFPIPGRDGAIERLGGFVLDMTERKRAEAALEQSREALFQTEKLSALGSLLAGVSHELNNPLSIVVAQAVMMERQAKGTELAERAFKIRKAADRCARIVQTFLAMARQKRPERAPVDLNNIVAAALELAEYGLRSDHITVTRRLDPTLPRIAADADQLHQVIVNLIVNAQHALSGIEGERAITIATAAGPEPQTVILDIADTGPGIPDEVARRIFEPFFTTKPQGEGTGVGLSFSQGLAEAHGGRLALLPSERGACFRLTLPLDADGVLAAAAPETIAALAPRRRRALVIDDEAEIAEALADFLGIEGYVCDVAVGGVAGKAKLISGDYDLVVSDLRMPELDGPELYRWLRETRPRLAERVAFTTGDTLGSAVARFLAEAQRPVLEKPFVPEAVRRFLDQMEQP